MYFTVLWGEVLAGDIFKECVLGHDGAITADHGLGHTGHQSGNNQGEHYHSTCKGEEKAIKNSSYPFNLPKSQTGPGRNCDRNDLG